MATVRSRRKTEWTVQIEDGEWYAVAFGSAPFFDECCDCSLVHRVRYAVSNGRLWVQYTRDKKKTEQARKRRGRP